MMEPVYRIYYGKYPDALDKEIPNEQISDVQGLQFRIEPGKPAEPKIDEVDFELKNLDHQGNEIYPDSWFEQESLSVEDGAVAPLQLFFRVEMTDFNNRGFTGVVSKKSYGKWRETVTVTIKDPRSLISESNTYMLKPFSFNQKELLEKGETQDTTAGFPDFWDTGFDLEGTEVTDEYLQFNVLKSPTAESWSEVEFEHDYPHHRNLHEVMHDNPPDYGTQLLENDTGNDRINATDTFRSTYVQIGENTILTRVFESVVAYIRVLERDGDGIPTETEQWAVLQMWVVHAKNGNYTTESEDTVLERGRFFEDDKGTDLVVNQKYSVTIYDYRYDDNDVLLDQPPNFDDGDMTYTNGYAIELNAAGDEYDISNSFGAFNVLDVTITAFEDHLYLGYYDGDTVDLFELSKIPDDHGWAYWADLMLFGWLDTEPTDILINLAMQLNCYLYFNEDGQIVFHDRLYHEDYLPDDLPPEAFEVQLQDIDPIGDQEDTYGFDSYKVEYSDRIPINNVESDYSRKQYVGAEGLRNRPALRSSDLTIEVYRSDDLGVPTLNDPVEQLVFRYSPDSEEFVGSLNDFIPTPEIQAQNFAKSWNYPVSLWPIKLDLNKYPASGIGKYFWVTRDGENQVYFIRDITYKQNWSVQIEAQKVGTWNG